MKKLIFLFIFLGIITLVSFPVEAKRVEGQVIKVDTHDQTMVLRVTGGLEKKYSLADNAELYYNNARADLGMYSPVTEDDFVSGYIETNKVGQLTKAKFYYLVREGKVVEMNNDKIVIRETESGIHDSYYISDQIDIYINHSPAKIKNISKEMRVLLILNHEYQVKKIAAFHYNHTGLIEKVDFKEETVVVNVGTRVAPDLRNFKLGGKMVGDCSNWEELARLLKKKTYVLGKILLDNSQQNIAFINLRSF